MLVQEQEQQQQRLLCEHHRLNKDSISTTAMAKSSGASEHSFPNTMVNNKFGGT